MCVCSLWCANRRVFKLANNNFLIKCGACCASGHDSVSAPCHCKECSGWQISWRRSLRAHGSPQKDRSAGRIAPGFLVSEKRRTHKTPHAPPCDEIGLLFYLVYSKTLNSTLRTAGARADTESQRWSGHAIEHYEGMCVGAMAFYTEWEKKWRSLGNAYSVSLKDVAGEYNEKQGLWQKIFRKESQFRSIYEFDDGCWGSRLDCIECARPSGIWAQGNIDGSGWFVIHCTIMMKMEHTILLIFKKTLVSYKKEVSDL